LKRQEAVKPKELRKQGHWGMLKHAITGHVYEKREARKKAAATTLLESIQNEFTVRGGGTKAKPKKVRANKQGEETQGEGRQLEETQVKHSRLRSGRSGRLVIYHQCQITTLDQ
jgi:hypothetical protein